MAKRVTRPRKIKSPEQMLELWEQYLLDCQHKTVPKTTIDKVTGLPVTIEVIAPVTPKIYGFCRDYLGITDNSFLATYSKDEIYGSVIEQIRRDCELFSVQCFEQGQIDSRLAGLLLSKYGYSTAVKQDIESDSTIKVVIDGEVGDYGV